MNSSALTSVAAAASAPELDPTDEVLDIRGLNISYGDSAPSVRGVSLSLNRGEILGLIGESGSGKSTVAMACAGLLPRTARVEAEHLRVCGTDVRGLDPKAWRQVRGRLVGTIFQDAMGALDPSMRVGNQLAEVIGRHRGLRGRERSAAVLELMERVGIPEPSHRARQYSFQLSGGLRQRVAIAMALAGDPQFLLADEPTTALDVTVQAGILELFRSVRDDFGVGVLLISHDMGVIAQTADLVGVMLNGEIVEQGSVRDVLSSPKADYTRKLLDAMPRIDGQHAPRESSTGPGSSLFLVQDLHKSFRSRGQEMAAVRGVSIEVRQGEVFSIVGESGSGKSTLARMLAGLETPTDGVIEFDGAPVAGKQRKGLAGRVQMVFQHPQGSLNPRLRIGTSVREPLGRSQTSATARERVAEAVAEVGLPLDSTGRYPHEFSGGQAQRIAIARALVASPTAVILDEPTSALDVSVQAQILQLLDELKRKKDLTYIFISHDLAVVRQISDRVAVMYAGEVVEVGDIDQVFQAPKHWYTKSLLAAVPSPDPRDRPVGRPSPAATPGGSAGTSAGGPACSFASRCANAANICRTSAPELVEQGAGHLAACHRPLGVPELSVRESDAGSA